MIIIFVYKKLKIYNLWFSLTLGVQSFPIDRNLSKEENVLKKLLIIKSNTLVQMRGRKPSQCIKVDNKVVFTLFNLS